MVKIPFHCHSAIRRDRNILVRSLVSTPIFSRTHFSMVLSVTLPDEIGNQKSKMAAEIVQFHVSQLINMIATKSQRLYPCFGVDQHEETSENTVRRLGISEIKDGGH